MSRFAVKACILALAVGGATSAAASTGAHAVEAHGVGRDLNVSAVATPSGRVEGVVKDFRGVNDVYCVDFRIAEDIVFVPDGSEMARVGATVRTPIDIVRQASYIFIKTPGGANYVWGPYGYGPDHDACDMTGWGDSVPPIPWDGTLTIRN